MNECDKREENKSSGQKRKPNTNGKGNDKIQKEKKDKASTKEKVCKSCGLKGHVRKSHHACLKNPKNGILKTGK